MRRRRLLSALAGIALLGGCANAHWADPPRRADVVIVNFPPGTAENPHWLSRG